MECDTATGLMPWFLNRTLPAAEAGDVQRHLAECAACREELESTRRAAAVFSAHPSASTIVDLAWDRPLADAALVRRHVDGCAGCAEDLSLARESRRAAEEPVSGPEAVPASRPDGLPARIARWVALPATLAAGLLIGLALPRSEGTPPAPPADPAVARLESELARLRDSVAVLSAQVEGARAPELNLPVFELLSAALTRGSAGGAANEVAIPKQARQVALLLVAEAPADAPAALEIRSAAGQPVWQAEGLLPNALGAYTLAVPASLLPEGEYVFVLRPRGSARVEYRVRVRPAP